MRSRGIAREFKSGDTQYLYAGSLSLEGQHEKLSIVANHWQTSGTMHIDVSRAHVHEKAQRPVLVRLPRRVKERMMHDKSV